MILSTLLAIAPAHGSAQDDILASVFVTMQRGTSSVAGDAIQKAALRQEAGNQALSALLRTRENVLEQLANEKQLLSGLVSQTGAAAEREVERLRVTLRDLEGQIAALDAKIELSFPAFKELTNPRPMTVSEVQDTLATDEVLIVTLSAEDHVFVWAISKTQADWHKADFETGVLVEHIKLLRRMLDVTTQNRAAEALDDAQDSIGVRADQFNREVAHSIYTKLLAPLEHIFGEADHLITVVDGPLTSLPLSVLVQSPPQGDDADIDALRATDWLIARYAMTVLPNVSSLRALRRVRPEGELGAPRRPFVGFGDPVFAYADDSTAATGTVTSGYVNRGVFEGLKGVGALAQLPGTARELGQLATLTGADEKDVFLGRAATESAVRTTDLSGVDILVFATHGLMSGELNGLSEPALVFTPPSEPSVDDDALLMASEAASLKLSATLIILSACNTAASDGTPGAEGLSGLARSFIYAGARSILVSHWPVDDAATSLLTTGMVAQMQNGKPKSAALRHSILTLMEGGSNPQHAHPRYWAPFILVGEG